MSQLQNKLLHYEVPPPSGVWNKIEPLLDENLSPALSEKLYQYEENPSLSVWQNIDRQLNIPSSDGSKVVPFFIRYKKPLKYSGAAAILFFIAVLTSLLISKKTESELPTNSIVQNNIIEKDSTNPFNSQKKNSLLSTKENAKTDQLVVKSNTPRERQTSAKHSFSAIESLLPHRAERNDVASTSIDADKYMIYSDKEGNAIRLPKKIFSAFTCPTDDMLCKQRLQQLREKFAASAMTADFNGLLQILKGLQENQ
jgi:hypothetical protein